MRWWWVWVWRDGGNSGRLGICCVAQNRNAALQLWTQPRLHEIHTSGSSLVSQRSQAREHIRKWHVLRTRSWLRPVCTVCGVLCFVHAVGLAEVWSVVFSDEGVCRGVAPARVSSWRSSDLRFPPRNPTHCRWSDGRRRRGPLTFVPEGFTHENTRDPLNGNDSSAVREPCEETCRLSVRPPVGLTLAACFGSKLCSYCSAWRETTGNNLSGQSHRCIVRAVHLSWLTVGV